MSCSKDGFMTGVKKVSRCCNLATLILGLEDECNGI